jgi:hypothetical protein
VITFEAWPKTPRLSADRTSITEKIDGTNAAVIIQNLGPAGLEGFIPDPEATPPVIGRDNNAYIVGAQSRKRLITPESDNYGFASWVWENREDIVDLLGSGRHFGEWWGRGIQRGYGMDRKVFSLFNYFRFSKIAQERHDWRNRARGINMATVPMISVGKFSDTNIKDALDLLRENGSFASAEWGVLFDRPEGIIIRHADLGGNLKAFIENDDIPKGLQ